MVYNFLKERPAPKADCSVKINRVVGGYIIQVSPMTHSDKFYPSLKFVAKSFSEALLILKDWESSPIDNHE